MKYFFLTIAFMSAALVSCGGNKKKTEEPKAPEVAAVNPGSLKIAFYYSDSVAKHYTYLREQDSLMRIKQTKFEGEMMRRQKQLESLAQRMEEKRKAMTATGAELQQMENNLVRLQQDGQMYQQTEGTKLQKEADEIQTVLQKKMEAASSEYCKKYGVDILLVHGAGGQIAYIQAKMDVTKSFTDFLNAKQDEMNKDMGK